MAQKRRRRPPQRRERRERQQEKKSSAKTFIYVGILIVAVAGLGWYFFYEFGFRTEYNLRLPNLMTAFKTSIQTRSKNV